MTEQQHLITPPPELLKQLARSGGYKIAPSWLVDILTASYQAGADQELDACFDWIANPRNSGMGLDIAASLSADLRAARRPKPPSLAEEALALVALIQGNKKMWRIEQLDVVRRALERLQQLEDQQ